MATDAAFFFFFEANYSIVVGFVTHQHASSVGTHGHPILNPPTPSPPHPSEMSQSTRLECPAACIELALVTYFTCRNIHVSVPSSQTTPPSPSPTESNSQPFTSASPSLSRISCCLEGPRATLPDRDAHHLETEFSVSRGGTPPLFSITCSEGGGVTQS